MEFTANKVAGSCVIDIRRIEDDRGFFARTWCEKELLDAGLTARIAQVNTALSIEKGTLRGMHFQHSPHEEVKIVSCTAGSVFDVVLDLRPDSETYRQWFGVELSAKNCRMLYVPEGCAHGYQTLEDNVMLTYATSAVYAPDAASGVRFDDPAFGIEWPLAVSVVSDADRGWPDFER